MKNPEEFASFAQNICGQYSAILNPLAAVRESKKITATGFDVRTLQTSVKGHPIDLISKGRNEAPNVFFYGFPDPGEAVGATGILCLLQALAKNHPFLSRIDVRWNFITCLNFDDQPDEGKSLAPIMKTGAQEVDWMVHTPRPETSALLQVNEELRPVFTFPMHDEWHCHEDIPCYFPVGGTLSPEICNGVRAIVKNFGFEASVESPHPTMGAGFFDIRTAPDIENSTFLRFAQNGTVFLCEVPDKPGTTAAATIGVQLAAGLFVMENSLSPTR